MALPLPAPEEFVPLVDLTNDVREILEGAAWGPDKLNVDVSFATPIFPCCIHYLKIVWNGKTEDGRDAEISIVHPCFSASYRLHPISIAGYIHDLVNDTLKQLSQAQAQEEKTDGR